MTWQPWEDYKDLKPPLLPIAAPPCPGCRYWEPMPDFHGRVFSGVKLCHLPDQMCHDFSCFKPKETEATR